MDEQVFNFISLLVFVLFMTLIGLGLKRSSDSVRKIFSNPTLLATMVLISLLLLAWNIVVFPGFISQDDLIATQLIDERQITIWTSALYGFLLSAFKILGLQFGGTPVVTTIIYWMVLVRVLDLLLTTQKTKSWINSGAALVFLLALWPTQLGYLTFHSRDALYGVLWAHLFFVLQDVRTGKTNRLDIFELGLNLAVVMLLRLEGFLIGALLLLFIVQQNFLSKSKKIAVTAFVLMIIFFNQLVSEQQPYWNEMAAQYQIAPYIATLSAILNSEQVNRDTESMQNLAKYYDLEYVRGLKNENWYSGGRGKALRGDAPAERGPGFYFTLGKVYAENFDAVTTHYGNKLYKTFNQSMYIQDLAVNSGATASGDELPLRKKIFRYLLENHRFKSGDFGVTYLLLATLLAVAALLLVKGGMRVLIGIIHLRILLVLALSADPQSKYLFSLCVFAPISLVLIMDHLSKRKRAVQV